MRRTRLLLLLIVFAAGISADARSLRARFSHGTYFAPGKGPYIETYIRIDGHSVSFAPAGTGNFSSTVEATLIVKQGDSIRYFDKFNLLGPEIADTLNGVQDFSDIHRISLPEGDYTLNLELRDRNQPGDPARTVSQDVALRFPTDRVNFSDILLLESYEKAETEGPRVKNGFLLTPLVDDFFGKERNRLVFYTEFYNSLSLLGESDLLLRYQLLQHENQRPLDDYSGFSRQKSREAGAFIGEFDISGLPSGNYQVQVELRDKQNTVLAGQTCFFQRSRPSELPADSGMTAAMAGFKDATGSFVVLYTNKDTLAEYIRCLWPISNPNENTFAINQLGIADLRMMQSFFYDFWYRRDASNPKGAWDKYHEEVKKVNANYSSGNKKGYLTERGRVYLRYGAPNQLSRMYNEPSSYPYEIWQYYTLGNQTNRKFVFYNPEIGGNDFRLLHSDARGEIFDSQWMAMLKRRTENMNDVDKTKPRSSWGNNYEQIFQNPR